MAAEAKNMRKNREITNRIISKKAKLESDRVVIVLFDCDKIDYII